MSNYYKRNELWRKLKHLSPNNTPTIAYIYSSKNDMIAEITKLSKKYKQQRLEKKSNKKFTVFINNPVHEKSLHPRTNDLLRNINSLRNQNNFILKLTYTVNGIETHRFLDDTNEITQLLQRIKNGFSTELVPTYGSDTEIIEEFILYGGDLTLTWLDKREYNKKTQGAYFKFYNRTELDLSRYQVYQKYQKIDYENCLIYTLKQAGIEDSVINKIDKDNLQTYLTLSNVKTLSELYDIQIELTYHDEKKQQKRVKKFNTKSKTIIKIGLVDEHYFLNEPTEYSASAIKHYNETKHHKLFPKVEYEPKAHKYKKSTKTLSSYEVIRNLYNQKKYIKPITLSNLNNTKSTETLIEYQQLRNPKKACTCGCVDALTKMHISREQLKGYILNCQSIGNMHELPLIYDGGIRPLKCICKKEHYNEYKDYSHSSTKTIFKGNFKKSKVNPNNNYNLIFVDLETHIKNNIHVPYCISYAYETDAQIYNIYGHNCVKQFLDSLTSNAVIITHNLAFDFRGFINELTNFQTPIETGTKLKMIQCRYQNYNLVFKDNCAFLPFKLSELPNMFNLKSGDKGAYPYNAINESNFDKKIKYSELKPHLKETEYTIFEDNCIKNKFCNDNIITDESIIDIKAYTEYYCNQDVNILKEAYLAFREQIKEITTLDIITLISLPQLADEFLKLQGVYNGVFSISGIANDFIRKCTVGGRTMTRRNEKWHIKNRILNDFDAVSLYPSAMYRLQGYLKGLPKVISEDEINNFHHNNFDGYYVEIKIKSVGIKRDFPLLSVKDKTGIRDFTNDIIDKLFYVDKTALQDLIKHQKIKYEIIRGYKFTDGFNTQIKETIKFLFEERLRQKNLKNPIQNAYKLIMNASYGKLIQKAIKKQKVFYEGDAKKSLNYAVRNHNLINSYVKINDNLTAFDMKKSIIQHFSVPHVASQVLSMSKRIMNEVICLAEDNKLNIYYQDTDSMHIEDKDIQKLNYLYQETYGRELIGKNMGQFHSDFDNDAVAIESIFLGKKAYIDKLQYEKDGKIEYGFHIRMKGMPSKIIMEFNDDYLQTYQSLFENEKIEFNMTKYCPLEMMKNYTVINRNKKNNNEFIRALQFNSNLKNIID